MRTQPKICETVIPDALNGGGNMTFSPGLGCNAPDGAVVFQDAKKNDWLRLESDGRVYVRGEPVVDPDAVFVYRTFKAWLAMAMGGPAPIEVMSEYVQKMKPLPAGETCEISPDAVVKTS